MSKTNVFTRISAYALVTMAVLLFGAACGSRCAIELLEGPGLWVGQITTRQPSFAPSWSEDGETIVFGYLANVYVVDAFGTEVKKWLPQGAPDDEDFAFDFGPVVTSKATDPASGHATSKVVFYTLRHSNGSEIKFDIGAAYLDGSDYKRLTDEDGSDLAPAWSLDGSRIAFVSNRAGLASREDTLSPAWAFNVYAMDADGSNVRSVAPGIFLSYPGAGRSLHRPVWSPDGAWLAFRGWRSLYTVHTEFFVPVNLGFTNTDPAWSPDGEWIAFVHLEPDLEQPGTIYVARPNGSKAREVFRFDSQDVVYPDALNLSWSPDGLSLRFSFRPGDSDRDKIYGLYQVGIDGSDLQKVSDVPSRAKIVWSPDGSKVAISHIGVSKYPKYEHGEVLLYTMASDGSDRRILVRQGRNGPEAANGE